jgi:hypothetical protein
MLFEKGDKSVPPVAELFWLHIVPCHFCVGWFINSFLEYHSLLKSDAERSITYRLVSHLPLSSSMEESEVFDLSVVEFFRHFA